MQGIKVSFDQDSIKKAREQFNNLLTEFENKANTTLNIKIGNLGEVQQQVNQFNASVKKLKIFDSEDLRKNNAEIFKSIDDVKKKYEGLGEISFPNIMKDADENIQGFTVQLKEADGLVKQFKYNLVNVASGSNLDKFFMLGSIKEIDKTSEIYEKQNQQIQQINKSIENEKLDNKELIEQENRKLELFKLQYAEKIKLLRDNKVVPDSVINDFETRVGSTVSTGDVNKEQIKQYYNDILRLQEELNTKKREEQKITSDVINEQLKEQERIQKLGEFKTTFDPGMFEKSNQEIKDYVQNIYGGDAKVVSFRKSLDGANNSVIKMTVSTKNSKNEIQQESIIMDKNTSSLYKNEEAIKANTSRMMGFKEKLGVAVASLITWQIGTEAVYGSLRKLKEGIQFINDMNKAQTNIQMITGMSHEQTVQLTKDYSALAGELHETTSGMMKASEEFLRSGRNAKETAELLKASTVASKIAGEDQKTVAEELISITNGFKMNATEAMDVVDKLTTIDNNAATSFKELAEAMSRTSSSAQLSGVNISQLASWIGTVSSVTRKSASSIGES